MVVRPAGAEDVHPLHPRRPAEDTGKDQPWERVPEERGRVSGP